jgi:AcrR family transcriptional regulator
MSTSKYHHGDLRQSLIKAGGALLREHGIAALTLRATAREAGVSATATYRHFSDKEALLTAIAADGFSALETALRVADQHPDDRIALRQQGVAYVQFAIANPDLVRLMFSGTIDRTAISPTTFAVLANRAARCVGAENAEIVALGSWSIVHGLATLIIDQRIKTDDPTALAERILAQLNLDHR